MYKFAKDAEMKIWYMNGAGNSFCIADARNEKLDMSALAVRLCRERGCDGFMALEKSETADFKLNFYNEDGSRAEMCGNGARCICRFAYENSIAGEKMTVETDAGELFGERVSESRYRIRLNLPQNITLNKIQGVDYAVVGVPHAVIKRDALDWSKSDELFESARELRYHECFERGANVSFYAFEGVDSVRILTYERGVEGFTKACGTGSGALAAILWQKGELSSSTVTVKNRGGDLSVIIGSNGSEITELYLEGETEIDGVKEY